MSELSLLQALRFKGRLAPEEAAITTGLAEADAEGALQTLVGKELASQVKTAYRITPTGRERLARLLDAERAGIDHRALEAAYDDYDEVNSAVKEIVTAWQMKDADTPNDHADPDYDAGVIERLVSLHERFHSLLDQIIEVAPRLTRYRARFATAIDRIRAGDQSFVARPIVDSYHTVWFELHEELIGLLGRTRADEAAAGRAV